MHSWTLSALALVVFCSVEGATAAMPSAASTPVELHNPANNQNVFSVFIDAAAVAPRAGSIREQTAAIAALLTVKKASAGVAVLDNGWETNEVARASFNDTIDHYGWAFLAVATNPAMDNMQQAVAAGYVEAQLTQHRIYQFAINTGLLTPFPADEIKFMEANEAYLDVQTAAEAKSDYWEQVKLMSAQNIALELGYNDTAPANELLQDRAVISITIGNDISTVLAAQARNNSGPIKDSGISSDLMGGHCSGFVRVTPNNQDVYFSHDTWSSFNSMLRIWKIYDFPYSLVESPNSIVPSRRTLFSSYPGTINSGDDFYLCSYGLAVMETTIGTYNMSSLSLITPSSVLEWQRVMVASRLATSGGQWASLFATENSGTYNNQYMVLNYNLFTPGEPLKDDLFWVIEQIPGLVKSGDLTWRLRQHSYFASYNVPQFDEVAALSGVYAMTAKYGEWFSYNETARAKIFRRNASMVTSLPSMQALMRYNNFKHDPLSQCKCSPPYTAENAIACRDDLNMANGTYSLSFFGRRNHCATDTKLTSYSLFKDLAARIISAPTYDQQPVFVWSTSWLNDAVSHVGLPDRWDFPWVQVSWD